MSLWRKRLGWTIAIVSWLTIGWDLLFLPGNTLSDWMFAVGLVIAALVGALIINKAPNNAVGWLLLVVGAGEPLGAINQWYLESLGGPPPTVGFGLIVSSWFSNFSWILLVFPLFLLLQVFPTGRLLSSRWRWVVVLVVVMALIFSALVLLAPTVGPFEGGWSAPNPLAALPADAFTNIQTVWLLGLVLLALAGGVSMSFRYRRSGYVERQQLKTILAAFLLFVAAYVASGLINNTNWAVLPLWLDLTFGLSIAVVPIAIGIAILRRRLFDIDLVIRRTLLYAILTGLLTAVYLASIFLLQGAFGLRARASWQVAASTLLVTALFNPSRRRLQAVIERRLFRRRYDAQLVAERFASSAQTQSDLDALSADLISIVQQTIQPSRAQLWIRA